MTLQGRVIYLPPMPDPKKVREGIREIIYLVQNQEFNVLKGERLNLLSQGKSDTLQN